MAGNKYYEAERARQAQFKKLEAKREKLYREELKKESEFEYLSALHPEDSTKEYNPVEHYQEGGMMNQPHLNYMGAAKGKFIAKG